MGVTITQQPKYKLIPVGSPIAYTVYHDPTIQNKVKIKYTAKVFVHTSISTLTNIENRVAVLKVTPNGAGRGIFDLAPILENYVSPDYEGGQTISDDPTYKSQYNSLEYSEFAPHTIHQIDKFCCNQNSVRFVHIAFNVEAANTATENVTQQTNDQNSTTILIYNGVLYDTDVLKLDSSGNYGYNLDQDINSNGVYSNFILNNTVARFLTNSPRFKKAGNVSEHYIQYVRDNDYLTLAFFSEYSWDFVVASSASGFFAVKGIRTKFYYNGSAVVDNIRQLGGSTGGHYGNALDSNVKIQYAGVGLGNLVGAGITIPSNWDYYTVHAEDDASNQISDTYYFYPQVDDCKGFETIRLTWLNKFGVWDYYNFTKKSVRSFNTKRKSYTQITGSWNGNRHMLKGYTGGKKNYNTSVSEKMKLNTDYITEEEAVWLEELFISNEVYILESRSTDSSTEGYMRKYIKPALITNSTHTRKTKANDRLIQYTFEIEITKTKKTQKI